MNPRDVITKDVTVNDLKKAKKNPFIRTSEDWSMDEDEFDDIAERLKKDKKFQGLNDKAAHVYVRNKYGKQTRGDEHEIHNLVVSGSEYGAGV